jgi:UDP-GlcNAc3NAcA epimerase
MKIIAIIGARPQFIKHFPFEKAAEGRFDLITIHTGQHYDNNMSEIFFTQLKMKKPNYTLQAGGGNHGAQTGAMMIEIEKIVEKEKPDGFVVYGDTNSTLAGALVASKLHIPIFHIEAGLRSYNQEMPEEINRVLTDHISSILFTPSDIAVKNLEHEGISKGVHLVGDIMKDLVKIVQNENIIAQRPLELPYYYVTIHRPYNTDYPERLKLVLQNLNDLEKKVVMALHPRTRNLMKKFKINPNGFSNIKFIEPQSYFTNLTFLAHCDGLITDSGGMQKEAYWLKKKCTTIRKETEWIETVELNGNHLVFEDLSEIEKILKDIPENWKDDLYGDGLTSKKIVDLIYKNLNLL